MSEFSQAWVDAHNARASKENRIPVPADACADESQLHLEIAAECRRRGWLFVRSRMDKPTRQAAGIPDFLIAAPAGRTLWIECKAKGRKLTEEQFATQRWLQREGHFAHTVWSFSEFLQLLKNL